MSRKNRASRRNKPSHTINPPPNPDPNPDPLCAAVVTGINPPVLETPVVVCCVPAAFFALAPLWPLEPVEAPCPVLLVWPPLLVAGAPPVDEPHVGVEVPDDELTWLGW